jgi:hypothetical protein
VSHLDFVITRAEPVPGGGKVATSVWAILREPGVAASLVPFELSPPAASSGAL